MAINFCVYEPIELELPQGGGEGEGDQKETEAGLDIEISFWSRRRHRKCYTAAKLRHDLTWLRPW